METSVQLFRESDNLERYTQLQDNPYYLKLPPDTRVVRQLTLEPKMLWGYNFGTTEHYRQTVRRKYSGLVNKITFDTNLELTQERVEKMADLGIECVVATFDWGEPLTEGHLDEVAREIDLYDAAGISVATYHQGLVLPSGAGFDHLMAKTPLGGDFPYFGTRYMACPNNPELLALRQESIRKAVSVADGKVSRHYIDNPIYPWMHKPRDPDQVAYLPLTCYCEHCQRAFADIAGQDLIKPYHSWNTDDFESRQAFRTETLYRYFSALVEASDLAAEQAGRDPLPFHANIFDINGDARFTERLTGLPVHRLAAEGKLSGVFIENTHSGQNLSHLNQLAEVLEPLGAVVTNLPYDAHIGYTPPMTQEQLNQRYAYHEQMQTGTCIKTIEFTEIDADGVAHWSNLDLDSLSRPEDVSGVGSFADLPGMREYKAENTKVRSVMARTLLYYSAPAVMSWYFGTGLLKPRVKKKIFEKMAVI